MFFSINICSPSQDRPVSFIITRSILRSTIYIFWAIFFFFLSSGGWGKIKLKLTTLPRIFIRVVCRFNSVAITTTFSSLQQDHSSSCSPSQDRSLSFTITRSTSFSSSSQLSVLQSSLDATSTSPYHRDRANNTQQLCCSQSHSLASEPANGNDRIAVCIPTRPLEARPCAE